LNALGLQPQDVGHPRAKRYRRLATFTSTELRDAHPDALREILFTGGSLALPAEASSQPTITPTQPPADAPTLDINSNTNTKTTANKPYTSPAYHQIRTRNGLTNFEVTESAPDPLRCLASVHDVVCMDVERHDAPPRNGTDVTAHGNACNVDAPAAAQGGEHLHGSNAQHGESLLCNYMPMVREYLENKQDNKVHTDIDMDEYVYDLYVEAASRKPGDVDGDGTGGDADVDENADVGLHAWWDLHGRGIAPIVRIMQDDTWLVLETSDVEDSVAGTEDSNAEAYYGNDYPEEEDNSQAWESSSDDGKDRKERQCFGGSGSASDDDDDDYW
jgi:hypothetical protein